MPTYDFECEKCAYYTEIFQKHTDPSTHECPHCGKETLSIGQMADRNTQKMGKYELEDKKQEHGINKSREGQETRDMHKKINHMTETQKVKWIRDGD